MRIAIIGGGNIGSALADGALSRGLVTPENLTIFEREPKRIAALRASLKCEVLEASTLPSNTLQSGMWDIVLLAVKPQDFPSAAPAYLPLLASKTLIVSIMAGMTINRISALMNGHSVIVRSMPNLPVKVGRGMTVYTASSAVTPEQRMVTEALFNATGRSLYLPDETLMDAATAVSGTGPAYLFYLIECMIEAARNLGFTEPQAELLSYQTFLGALELWWDSPDSAAKLREMVTSRGGTTEAAFKVFDSEGLGRTFARGVKRACERASELADSTK